MSNKREIVVIGAGNAGIKTAISAMLKATDAMMVLGDVAEKAVFEFNGLPREPIDIQLIQQKEHGAYRQFEKRDKRKNFRK